MANAIINYKDVLLKTDYYRKIVIKELAKYGQPITNQSIEDRLKNIDRYLAIFKQKNRKPEERFDAALFTKEMSEIHQDLQFLYELLYDLAVVEFEDIKAFADGHLREIEKKTREYKARVDIETNSSFIGETIFYMDGPFPWFTKDNYTFTELGEVDIRPGSKIAFLVSGTNLSNENIMLGLIKGSETKYVQPYNYQHDTFTAKGSSAVNSYEVEINHDVLLKDTFELTHEALEPNSKSSYIAYKGRNKILTTQNKEREHVAQEADYSFLVDGNWEVSFYIKGGTYAKFEFSKEIKNKNFEGIELRNLSSVHRIRMKDEGAFAFSVKTDGEIYAEQEMCYAKDSKLIHMGGSLSNDFMIEEYTSSEPERYSVFLRVFSDHEEYPEIDSVAIKELTESDVIINDLL
jgi:hypothetical protein